MKNNGKPGWLFRHPKDRAPALLVLVAFTLQITLLIGVHDALLQLGAIVLLLPVLLVSNAILHNHYHNPTFRFRLPNRIFETILFLQTGIPAYGWQLNHNLGHHRHWQNQDPSHPRVDEYRWLEPDRRIATRWRYTLRTYVVGYASMVRNGPSHPGVYRRFKVTLAVNAILLAGLIGLRPLGTIIVFVVPMVVVGLAMAWFSYAHHVGLIDADPYAASYTQLGRLSNLIAFNTGYHTAHHVNPGVHWSQLPEYHSTIRDRIPAHCYHDGKIPLRFDVAADPTGPGTPAAEPGT